MHGLIDERTYSRALPLRYCHACWITYGGKGPSGAPVAELGRKLGSTSPADKQRASAAPVIRPAKVAAQQQRFPGMHMAPPPRVAAHQQKQPETRPLTRTAIAAHQQQQQQQQPAMAMPQQGRPSKVTNLNSCRCGKGAAKDCVAQSCKKCCNAGARCKRHADIDSASDVSSVHELTREAEQLRRELAKEKKAKEELEAKRTRSSERHQGELERVRAQNAESDRAAGNKPEREKHACMICQEQLFAKEGLLCAKRHFVCTDCLGGYVGSAFDPDAVGRTTDERGNVRCPFADGCDETYSIYDLAQQPGAEAAKEIIEQLVELRSLFRMKQELPDALEAERARMKAEFDHIMRTWIPPHRPSFVKIIFDFVPLCSTLATLLHYRVRTPSPSIVNNERDCRHGSSLYSQSRSARMWHTLRV
jgi:hypothetical protein